MKKYPFILLMTFLLTAGCANGKPPQPDHTAIPVSTEVPCPGITPRGLATGIQAYVTLNGPAVSTTLYSLPEKKEKIGMVLHHIRVNLIEGPVCAESSAWWKVAVPAGKTGWMQIGSSLEENGTKYEAILEPFYNDAVQRDVPEDKMKEAQIRYIVADIELGGIDVLQYYKDQVAAKPDDPETQKIQAALEIIAAGNGKPVLSNAVAFERKPLRGGTSVVDAGTEFVQPGLDILLEPCDATDSPAPACGVLSQ